MGTLNGFGTAYLGWQHREDGTAEATKWVVALFIPVFPLKRHRLRLLHDPDTEPTIDPMKGPLAVAGAASAQTEIEILEELPLSWKAIGKTCLRAYVGLPLLLGIPLALALITMWAIHKYVPDDSSMTVLVLQVLPILVWMGYFFAVAATLVHRMRGGRK